MISTVIPLFNKRETIGRAIASFQRQSHVDKELIIVDDGSTDNSFAVVNGFLGDVSIKYIRQENKGVSAARNFGIRMAAAEYVCLLDADDEMEAGYLSEMAGLIERWPDSAFFSCYRRTVDSDLGETPVRHLKCQDCSGPVRNFFKCYYKSVSIVCSSSVCINKEIFLRSKGFPEGASVGEDIYMWLKLGTLGRFVLCSQTLVTVYSNIRGRAEERLRDQKPFHLRYFLEDGHLSAIQGGDREWCKRFLLKSALLHAAGAAAGGNRKYVVWTMSIVARYSYAHAVFVLVLLCTPSKILRIAQRVKRRNRSGRGKFA